MALTKAELRRRPTAKVVKTSIRDTTLLPVTRKEWMRWASGGWMSLWSEVELAEARELLRLIDDFHRAESAKERFRYAPVIRAGRKRLGLFLPSPLPDEAATADTDRPAKRKDPRV